MQPYNNKKVNKVKLISEFLYCIATFLMIFLPLLESDTYLKYYTIISWIILGLFITLTICELLTLLLKKKTKIQDVHIVGNTGYKLRRGIRKLQT